MPVYTTRRDTEAYGYCVGILLLDYRGAFVPGDVGNATTYGYPVLYKTVPEATTSRVLAGDPELEKAVIEAARDLERQDVKGISSDCGFFINYQDVVTGAVRVPVFLSSLLQLPLVSSLIGDDRSIGVITASSHALGRRVLDLTGVDSDRKVVIRGMQDEPEFDRAVMKEGDTLDTDRIEGETVDVARRMVREHPDLGAILLECSMLPPYAKAVQEATGLPVFDFITLIDFFQKGTHQKDYRGYN